MDEITDDKSLVAALKKAHQDTKDLDYKVREKRLDEAVSLAVKKAFDLMGFDGVFQTYRRIEEANGGETFTSEILDNDARDSLESAVTELAIERKSEMTEKQRHNLFETNILYRGLSVSRSKTLADNLGLQLTPERLKLIQEGLVRNSKRADQFWILQDQFGVPFTAEVARRYVDYAFRKNSKHVSAEAVMRVIDYFELNFTPEEMEEYVRIMVKNKNFDDASSVAYSFGLPDKWITEEQKRLEKEAFMAKLRSGKSVGWYLAFDRLPKEFRGSFAKENPSDFEKIVQSCAKEEWHKHDDEFKRYWPDHVKKLFRERKKLFYSAKSGYSKVAQVSAMLQLMKENPGFKKLISDEDLRNFADAAVESKEYDGHDYIWVYVHLINNAGFSQSDSEIEQVLRKVIDGPAFDYYESIGRELSPEFRKDLFEAQRKAIVQDKRCGDLIKIAKTLGQPVDKQLHIDNLASATPAFSLHYMKKYGLQGLSKEDKQSVYDKLVKSMYWWDFDDLEKVASALDIKFDVSVIIPKLKKYLKGDYPNIEKLEEFYDRYRIGGEIILDGFLNVRYAGPAARIAIKSGADREKVVDYFVKHRKDTSWNALGAAYRSAVDIAIIDASAKLDKLGYFFKRVVEEGDVDWIANTMMVAQSKKEIRDALKSSPELREAFKNMYVLQDSLLQSGKFSEAERLLKIFPPIPESPLMKEYKKLQN